MISATSAKEQRFLFSFLWRRSSPSPDSYLQRNAPRPPRACGSSPRPIISTLICSWSSLIRVYCPIETSLCHVETVERPGALCWPRTRGESVCPRTARERGFALGASRVASLGKPDVRHALRPWASQTYVTRCVPGQARRTSRVASLGKPDVRHALRRPRAAQRCWVVSAPIAFAEPLTQYVMHWVPVKGDCVTQCGSRVLTKDAPPGKTTRLYMAHLDSVEQIKVQKH